MGRPAQIFDAPGPPDEPLPVESSPWFEGRYVRIPLEYWTLLQEFAGRLEAGGADRLERLSGTAFVNEIALEREELVEDRAFLARALDELEKGPELVPEPDDEYPDAFPNQEIARMGRAVLAVLDESLRRREPFRAWDE